MDRRLRSLLWLLVALVPLGLVMTATVRGLLRAEGRARSAQRTAQALIAVDGLASSLLLAEALRPAESWLAFHQPRAFGQAAAVRMPSPLLAGAEPPVRLYFQRDADGILSSPQIPDPADQHLAQPYHSEDQRQSAARLLAALAAADHSWPDLSLDLPPMLEGSALPAEDHGPAPAQISHDTVSKTIGQFNNDLMNRNIDQRRASVYAQQQVAEVPVPQSESQSDRIAIVASDSPRAQRTEVTIRPQLDLNPSVRIGPMQARWSQGELLLLRWADLGEGPLLQGLWLDHTAVTALLQPALDAVLPGARVIPDLDDGQDDALSINALPLRLSLPPADDRAEPATRILLWFLAGAAALAIGAAIGLLLLSGTLAERRAAFVSAVTHELRTPLTALRLHADLLADARIADDAGRRATTIATLRSQAARLAGLIDNVLDYARLERRRGPRCTTLDLPAVIDRSQQAWQARLGAVGLELVITPEQSPCQVHADADALQRILDNLIDNAAKYAHQGQPAQVALSWCKTGRWCSITVRDHGPGLPRGRIPRPGERSAEIAAGQAPGIGLGLELCRRLARSMGGSLHCHPAQPGLRVELRVRGG